MRTQYTLTPIKQADVFNIAFYADTLQVINFTPYVLYLRIGDNITAGADSYHSLIPPATAATIPCYAKNFSAALAVGGSVGFTTVLAQRADFIFTANELVPNLSQLTLSIQNGQVFRSPLLGAGAWQRYTIDARGFAAISLTCLVPGLQTLGITVEVSPDAGVTGWSPLKCFRVSPGVAATTLDTFLPNPYGWFRVSLFNDGGIGWIISVILIYNLLHVVPPVGSFRNEVSYTVTQFASPLVAGVWLPIVTYLRFSGHLKKLRIMAQGPFDVNPASPNYTLPLTVQALIQTDITYVVDVLRLPPASWSLDLAGTVQEMWWQVDLDIYAAISLDVQIMVAGPGVWAGNEAYVEGTVEIGEER